MKDVKWVNNLKLRASYGETGNDNILDSDGDPDYYPYQTLYGLGYKNGSRSWSLLHGDSQSLIEMGNTNIYGYCS